MTISIDQLKHYVRQHIHHLHTIQDLAEALNVPAETLRRTFRRAEGLSLSRFITQVGVDKAKELLQETNLLCFEICFAVGFKREDTGAKVFKRVTGATMKTWRARNRQPKPATETGKALDP